EACGHGIENHTNAGKRGQQRAGGCLRSGNGSWSGGGCPWAGRGGRGCKQRGLQTGLYRSWREEAVRGEVQVGMERSLFAEGVFERGAALKDRDSGIFERATIERFDAGDFFKG